MGERQVITITAGTIVKGVLILAGFFALYELRGIVLDVLTAITVASAIEPIVGRLHAHKVPRVLSVLLIYLMLFGVFFCIFFFFVPTLFVNVVSLVGAIPGYVTRLSEVGSVGEYVQFLGIPTKAAISSQTAIGAINGFFGTGNPSNTFAAASRIFGSLFSAGIIVVFSFYFAVLETSIDDFLRIIVPKNYREYSLGLWKRSQKKIGLWMQGQLVLAFIIGLIVYVGLLLIRVPNAMVLALVAACFEIIPVFGPTLSAVPAVLVAFGSGGLSAGLLTIALFVVAQQLENHFIYPAVVTRVVGVPPLLVILSVIVGGELAGFLGVVLSVPAAAIVQEFVRDVEGERLPKRLSS